MKALVFDNGEPRLLTRPEPEVGPGEALVRVTLAGICGTDLELAAGYMCFKGVPGHEFTGTVEKAPETGWKGKRVTGEINVPCGSCYYCRHELDGHCPERTVLGISGRDGAFAEFMTLPLNNLHHIPDGVPDEAAVFTEPLAAAYRILEQTTVKPGVRSLVLGDGRLGQLCASVLDRAGSPPVVCGKHPEKLSLLEKKGFRTLLGLDGIGRDFDLVVEATGSPAGMQIAAEHVRPRGTIIIKSTFHGKGNSNLTPIVVDEVHVIGSRCGPFPPALEHLAADPSVTQGLVSAVYPLEDAFTAFQHARRHDALKILLKT